MHEGGTGAHGRTGLIRRAVTARREGEWKAAGSARQRGGERGRHLCVEILACDDYPAAELCDEVRALAFHIETCQRKSRVRACR